MKDHPKQQAKANGTEAAHSDQRSLHGTVLAEGQRGWDITPFEGNFYIRSRCLKGEFFRVTYMPGICPYKGLYVWLDFQLPGRTAVKSLAWLYWLPNPLFPFIWYRVALPGSHPDLLIEEFAT